MIGMAEDPQVAPDAAALLRSGRAAAGLTQRELAARSGIPQTDIAAYERGRRSPDPATTARLELALRAPTLALVRARRDEILEIARRRRLGNVRVFGSVARDDSDELSDVDLLVHPGDGASLFDLAGFMSEAEELLGVRVDVIADEGRGPVMPHVLRDAVPL